MAKHDVKITNFQNKHVGQYEILHKKMFKSYEEFIRGELYYLLCTKPWLYFIIFSYWMTGYYYTRLGLIMSFGIAVMIALTQELLRIEYIYKMWCIHICDLNPDYQDLQHYFSKKGRLFLVAEIDGKIVGTVAMNEDTEKDTCYLRLLMVDSNYRRLGLGTRLMQRIEQEAQEMGYRNASLTTNNCNHNAKKLYQN